MTQTIILAAAFVVVAGGILFYFSRKLNQLKPKDGDEQVYNILIQHMTQNFTALNDKVNGIQDTVYKELKNQQESFSTNMRGQTEFVSKNILETNKSIGERLDNAAKAYSQLHGKLTQIEEANKRIYDVGKDIASLQDILRAPKIRGTHGEIFLGNLLGQILPTEHYQLQHTFKSKETVDAVIILKDQLLVPIDSKFPLEDFKKMISATDENEKLQYKKMFTNDVKKHVDAIAKKYILPDEKTLDFALMYIPAENVYYETITKHDDIEGLDEYCFKKKVIPVSPNNLYVYLQTILMGLKGMQIEKGAKDILNNLARLRGDFSKFSEDFDKVGTHLTHARGSYEQSVKRLERFNDKFAQVGGFDSNQTSLLEEKTEIAEL